MTTPSLPLAQEVIAIIAGAKQRAAVAVNSDSAVSGPIMASKW